MISQYISLLHVRLDSSFFFATMMVFRYNDGCNISLPVDNPISAISLSAEVDCRRIWGFVGGFGDDGMDNGKDRLGSG